MFIWNMHTEYTEPSTHLYQDKVYFSTSPYDYLFSRLPFSTKKANSKEWFGIRNGKFIARMSCQTKIAHLEQKCVKRESRQRQNKLWHWHIHKILAFFPSWFPLIVKRGTWQQPDIWSKTTCIFRNFLLHSELRKIVYYTECKTKIFNRYFGS